MGGAGSSADNSPTQAVFLQGATLAAFRSELAALATHANVAIASCAPALATALAPLRRLGVETLISEIEVIVSGPACQGVSGIQTSIPALIKLAVPETPQGERFAEAASTAWQSHHPAPTLAARRAERLLSRASVPELPHNAILKRLGENATAYAPDLLQAELWRDANSVLARMTEVRSTVDKAHAFEFEYAMASITKLVMADALGEAVKYLDSMDRERARFAVLIFQEALHKFEPQRSFKSQLAVLRQVQDGGHVHAKPYVRIILEAAKLFKDRLSLDANKKRPEGE